MSQESDEDLSIRMASGGSSSSRSRQAVIEGSKSFAWSNEKVRSDQPYIDGRYHMPHNPPPQGQGFVGGIGRKLGRIRSKVHPQRPTQLEQICGMRNQNMILHSFTQPIAEVYSPQKRPKGPKKTISSIVKEVTSADMNTGSQSQLDSTSLISSSLSSQKKSKQPAAPHPSSDAPTVENAIDGKPFYYSPKAITERVQSYLESTNKEDIYATASLPVTDEQAFRNWAMRIRGVHGSGHQRQQHSSDVDSDNGANSKATRSRTAADSYRTDGAQSSVANSRHQKPIRQNARNIIRKITGYMFGPFTKPATPDALMRDENKFGIPTSMTERVLSFEKRQSVQDEVLRRLRMENMGMHQPPARDDSSDENESTLNVKKLALVRTPYFALPAIRMDRVKRVQRFRNKYLRGDRLKRINLLLRDDKRPAQTKEMAEERTGRRQKYVLAKFAKLRAKKRAQKDVSGRDPEKAKYYEIIDTNYEQNRAKVERDDEVKPITFGQFKNIPDPVDLEHLAINLDPLEQRSDAASTERAHSLRSRFAKSQPRKLFERNRNERLSQLDNIDGPFYIDPNLMDKFRSPKKFKSPQKYYTNLIKGKHWIRDRLQVNGPAYDEEKVGEKGKQYYHRLATEWDEYYFHDLRHRPRVRKFCVKTDILAIRDIMRRNFVMYNVQENLMDMQAKQKKESKYMDNVEAFQKMCDTEMVAWKIQAYDKVVEANQRLEELREKIKVLRIEKTEQILVLDSANLRIFQIEERWNFLMKLQNYYYLLQSTEWRQKHDWIHRGTDGSLDVPMIAFKRCSQRNIRASRDSSGLLLKEFFDANIEPHLDRMRSVKPDVGQFKESLQSLNTNCMTGLRQHNHTFWMFKGVLGMSSRLVDQIKYSNEMKRDLIEILKVNSRSLMERSVQTKRDALALVDQSLPSAVRNPVERKVLAIASELHQHLRETAMLDTREAALTPLQRFQQVQQYAMDLFGQLDAIPLDVLRVSEKFMRAHRKMTRERMADALSKQKRYDLMRRQIENHFSEIAQFKRVQVSVPGRKVKPNE